MSKTTQSPPAVQVVEIAKTYKVGNMEYPALRGVSFRIEKGELASIIGPSGSGKSTILNIVGALDRPTSGRVFIDGINIRKMNDDQLSILRNRKIGFVYQSFNLIQRLSAAENVEMPLLARNMESTVRHNRALKILEAVGLGRKINKRPNELSGGEQQRVAVARALVTRPALVIGDEPTGNLDSKTTHDILDLITHVNKTTRATFILVTHNQEVAEKTHRIISIRDGLVEKEQRIHRLDSFTERVAPMIPLSHDTRTSEA